MTEEYKPLLEEHVSQCIQEGDKVRFDFQYGTDKDSGLAVVKSKLMDKVVIDYLKTKDEVVRKALIELGWTPPEEERR